MAASVSIDRDNAPVPPDGSPPHTGSNAILWLLLLLALLAAIWFFHDRSASNATVDATPATPVIAADAQQAAAQAERARADAAAARKAARKQPAASERTQATKPRIADRGPEPVARIEPKYPAVAYRNHEEGNVVVRADVDANGVPGDVAVVRRSGSRELDNAALAAVRQWHFRPAMNNGKAVASAVEVPIDFKLDER